MVKILEATKTNKKGVVVDATITLDRLDSNNLVLWEGKTSLGYFGDLYTALKRAKNFAVKGSDEEFTFELVLRKMEELDAKVDELQEMVRTGKCQDFKDLFCKERQDVK